MVRFPARFFLLSLLSSLSLLSGCGGGGGGSNSFAVSIGGNWSGQMYQASGIVCSDGSFIGAGVGTATRVVDLSIEGGNTPGSQVTIKTSGCVFEGQRISEAEVIALSTSDECGESVTMTDIESGSAVLAIDPGPPQPVDGGQVGCTVAESGPIEKSE